jgi:hypothetical protein
MQPDYDAALAMVELRAPMDAGEALRLICRELVTERLQCAIVERYLSKRLKNSNISTFVNEFNENSGPYLSEKPTRASRSAMQLNLPSRQRNS